VTGLPVLSPDGSAQVITPPKHARAAIVNDRSPVKRNERAAFRAINQ
jgi:hypothetical protein